MATKAPEKAVPKATKAKAGTAVAVKKTGAVVDVADIRAKLQAMAAKVGEQTNASGGNKIKPTKSGKFALPGGAEVEAPLQCVIVDFSTIHNFYEGKFDPKNIQPPACAAVGSNPKDMTPFKASPQLQADNCQECPMNQFGSDGQGKACKNGRRLALLPLNAEGTGVDADDDIMILEVSPTGLKGFDGYVRMVQSTFGMPPAGVITEIGLDSSVEYPKLTFSNPRPLTDDADLSAVVSRMGEAQPLIFFEPDFSGFTSQAKPAGKKPATARR